MIDHLVKEAPAMDNKAELPLETSNNISSVSKHLPIGGSLATPPRPMTGFFASLSPEQKAAALSYCGPEDLGDPNGVLMDAS